MRIYFMITYFLHILIFIQLLLSHTYALQNTSHKNEIQQQICPPLTNEQFINQYIPYQYVFPEGNQTLHQKAVQTVLNTGHNEPLSHQIPKITHKIWLTDLKNPHPIPEVCLQGMIGTYQNLKDYRHLIWTNCPEIIEDTIRRLQEANCTNLEVHSTDELVEMPCRRLFKVFMKHNFFANASDIVRLQVLSEFGGIYSDIGWKLQKALPNILQDFEYAARNFYEWRIDHNFLAIKANDFIFKDLLSQADDWELLEEKISTGNIRMVMELFCPGNITRSFEQKAEQDTKLLLLKAGSMTYFQNHLGSWYEDEGKFGAQTYKKCDMAKFREDCLIEFEKAPL